MSDGLFNPEERGPRAARATPLPKSSKVRKLKAGCRVPVPPRVKHFWRWFPRQQAFGVAHTERLLARVQERAGLTDEELRERVIAWARHKPDMAPWELEEAPPRPPVDIELPGAPAPIIFEPVALTERQRRGARSHRLTFQSAPMEEIDS